MKDGEIIIDDFLKPLQELAEKVKDIEKTDESNRESSRAEEIDV